MPSKLIKESSRRHRPRKRRCSTPYARPSAQTKVQTARGDANSAIVTKQEQLELLTQELADLRAKVLTPDQELEQRTREANEAEAEKNAVVGPKQEKNVANTAGVPPGDASSSNETVANDTGVAMQTMFSALQTTPKDIVNAHCVGDPEQLRALFVVLPTHLL